MTLPFYFRRYLAIGLTRRFRLLCASVILQLICAAAMAESASASGSLMLRGELQQGGMVSGLVKEADSLRLNSRAVKLAPDGQFVVGFGRDAPVDQSLSWFKGDVKLGQYDFTITTRKYNTQSIEGLPQKLVTPSEDKLERIRAEGALVKAARARFSEQRAFLTQFIMPARGTITGVFGSQRIYNGVPKRPHYGIDLAAPEGAPVIAPADGVVSLNHDNMYYSGGTLIIDHGYGISSTFIHLSKIDVAVGEQVKQGQKIAEIGSTGRSTGPHLDWRVNWFDVRLDPQLVLKH